MKLRDTVGVWFSELKDNWEECGFYWFSWQDRRKDARYRRYGDPVTTALEFSGGGHGGGDPVMAKEIVDSLLNDTPLEVSGSANGLACARVALAADLSARTGKIVEL